MATTFYYSEAGSEKKGTICCKGGRGKGGGPMLRLEGNGEVNKRVSIRMKQ